MSTRYASFGTDIRRSPKTSVVPPWHRRARMEHLDTTLPSVLTLTYGASAHAKGAWVEVNANTAQNVVMLGITVACNAPATDTSTVLDIGVGASGSETVVVPDLAVGAHAVFAFYIPVAIPAGSRVAVRMAGTRVSPTTATVAVALFAGNGYETTPTSVDVLGVTAASSSGTAMAGANGSWVQITASTAKDYQQVTLLPSSSATDIASASMVWFLGVGASGSERVIGSQIFRTANTEQVTMAAPGNQGAIPCFVSGEPVPAGSRLAVRHNIAVNPGRYNVCLIGIPYV